MGEPNNPSRVKLIAGIITSYDDAFDAARRLMEKRLGRADYVSNIIPFNSTDYYEKQMGPGLKRRFISFDKLIKPQDLASIKLLTNGLEKKLSRYFKETERPVNIDPGYITQAKLVLASTKDYSHRIYIGRGIYGEVTLYYKGESFRPFEWTYPDYRTQEYIKAFNDIRSLLMAQSRKTKI